MVVMKGEDGLIIDDQLSAEPISFDAPPEPGQVVVRESGLVVPV